LFSNCLFHADIVPGISTNELKLCCKHGESGLCSCWCVIVHAGYAPRLESRSLPWMLELWDLIQHGVHCYSFKCQLLWDKSLHVCVCVGFVRILCWDKCIFLQYK
jgi:hypothetical protein